MPLMLAPLPSRMPPATETLVAPEEIRINGTVTALLDARIVAVPATRHSLESRVRLAELTRYVRLVSRMTMTLVGLALRALLMAVWRVAMEPEVSFTVTRTSPDFCITNAVFGAA